eukprot:CAMPEP_0204521142 /NCGR_PEP_ID=MMETSP0661-20131031/5630_1 /ASSEMBLY_ACC=CAM_ASM_000606 /TAXON_ID=109239 /ORGANISM="Alexandrium margalefi, Strain AMGDE01CS-322" /LENGTH=120 /DNA_ID=CAMNT_0051526725 /DNA_START=46 /DNA_END=408 /DNA_ORIENTATION=-
MSRSGSTFQKLSKWLLPHCGGKQPLAASPAAGRNPAEAPRGKTKASREESNPETVPIDRETEVPADLYMLMVEAGKKARARGQHKKVPSVMQAARANSGGGRAHAYGPSHLVRSNQATAA